MNALAAAFRVPVIVYDGDCEFCRRWVRRWQESTEGKVLFVPYQTPGVLERLRISEEEARRAVQLVEPSGLHTSGGRAVARALSYVNRFKWLSFIASLPGLSSMNAWAYRKIAANRGAAERVDWLLFGSSVRPMQYGRVREIFHRGLGGVYLLAFLSARKDLPGNRAPIYRFLPELGALASIALMAGFAPRVCSAVLAGTYFALLRKFPDYLDYEGDRLLVETGANAAVLRETVDWPQVFLLRLQSVRLGPVSGMLALAPRRVRRASFWLMLANQAAQRFKRRGAQNAPGEWLHDALVPLVGLWRLDDEVLEPVIRSRGVSETATLSNWRKWAELALTLPLVAYSARTAWKMRKRYVDSEPFRVVLEGSADGTNWRPYEFAGRVAQLLRGGDLGPRVVPKWFEQLIFGLLSDPRTLKHQLKQSSVSDASPKFVRASLYDSDREGALWLGLYYPAVELGEAPGTLKRAG